MSPSQRFYKLYDFLHKRKIFSLFPLSGYYLSVTLSCGCYLETYINICFLTNSIGMRAAYSFKHPLFSGRILWLGLFVCLSALFKMLLLRQFVHDWADFLTRWSPTLEKLMVLTDSGFVRYDVINDVIKFSLSNGHISATDRPFDFALDPR